MSRCLELLKPDGLLLIQTPQFREDMRHEALAEAVSPFLEQLKADEHLYLFSQSSVAELFRRLGVEHLCFEPAIFAHYDMFFVASRMPMTANSAASIEAGLMATSGGRLVLALLDMDSRLQENIASLQDQLQAAEADRAARLEVIEQQGRELGKIGQLEADIDYLKEMLRVVEADRAVRLQEIRHLNDQLQALRSHWWSRVGKAIRTL
jgi:hypothetical protein